MATLRAWCCAACWKVAYALSPSVYGKSAIINFSLLKCKGIKHTMRHNRANIEHARFHQA